MEVICEIVFLINEDGSLSSKANFDSKYFKNDNNLANKVLEGLHYDFLERMKEEKLVTGEIKLDG